MIIVRQEKLEDAIGIRRVNEQAFGRISEANLVDKLRGREKIVLSLVALEDNLIVGHILFSPAAIESGERVFHGLALAPMAVSPQFQGQSIGSLLARTGLEQCKKTGYDWVVVLGDPEYYHRFGFVPASIYGIQCEFDVSDGVFMAIELKKRGLSNQAGTVKYQPEFNEV
jgi:putative acetyltransferase